MSTNDNSQDNHPENVDGDGTEQPEQPGVLFSQDEVNRINRRTKQQAEKRAVSELVERLGFETPEQLEAIVQAQKAAEAAAKSELEKAQEAKAKAEQKAEAALKAANDKLIRAALIAEAGKVQAQHPNDAYLLADLSAVELTDSGEVIGAEKAVKALVESGRLTIAGKPAPPNLDSGAGGGERPKEKAAKLTPEELQVAQKMGVSPENYAKYK